MLTIDRLQASIAEKAILRGIDLRVPDGEIHAIMGPNGSGKSTLAYVLSGRADFAVTGGAVRFNDADPAGNDAGSARRRRPVPPPSSRRWNCRASGNANFLRTALNAQRRARGEPELDAVQFLREAARPRSCLPYRRKC